MSIDPEVKFERARKGYDPQEVDAAFDAMQEEIEELKRQNLTLTSAIRQYGEKIGQFEDGSRRLEEERAKESQRLAAAWDRTEQTEAARDTLITMARNLHSVAESLLAQVEALIDEVMRDIEAAPAAAPDDTHSYRPKFAAYEAHDAHNGAVRISWPRAVYPQPGHAKTAWRSGG